MIGFSESIREWNMMELFIRGEGTPVKQGSSKSSH